MRFNATSRIFLILDLRSFIGFVSVRYRPLYHVQQTWSSKISLSPVKMYRNSVISLNNIVIPLVLASLTMIETNTAVRESLAMQYLTSAKEITVELNNNNSRVLIVKGNISIILSFSLETPKM